MTSSLSNILPINVVGTISGTTASGIPTSVYSPANIQHVVIVNEDPLGVSLVGNGILTAATGTFSQSLTVSGFPVITTDQVGLLNIVEDLTPQLGGNLDAQNNDISGVNELTAVTGTFTSGLTIGTGSTHIYPNEIRTNSLTASGSVQAGNFAGKNAIINGNFDIWQRGASFDKITHGACAADRWPFAVAGTPGLIDVDASGTVPDSTAQLSMKLTVDTLDGTIAAADHYLFSHTIEGYNAQRFGFGGAPAKTLTLSFWVRSSVTGTYSVSFRNGAKDRSYIAEYTISSANTWEKKTITFTADTAGTWNKDANAGLIVVFALAIGSTYATTADSWKAGSYLGSSNQVNWMANAGNTFYISQAQLELGDTATEFEHRSFGAELTLCRRYYQKTFRYDAAPSQNSNNFNGALRRWHVSGEEPVHVWHLPVALRVYASTITLYAVGLGTTSGQWGNFDGTYSATATRAIQPSETSIPIDHTGSTWSPGVNTQVYIHADADAEF